MNACLSAGGCTPGVRSTPGASERRRASEVRHTPEAINEDETDVNELYTKLMPTYLKS